MVTSQKITKRKRAAPIKRKWKGTLNEMKVWQRDLGFDPKQDIEVQQLENQRKAQI